MKLLVDEKIYPIEAIKLTASFFSEEADIDIEEKGKKIEINIKQAGGEKKSNADLLRNFKKELLYNSIRYMVAKNNQKIREYIVSQALYSSYPSEIEEFLSKTEESYVEDPLKIAVPWEESQKKTKENKKKNKKEKRNKK